jgi:hypothetical protein
MAVFGGLNLIFPYETKVSSMMLAGGALIGGYFIPSSYGSFDQYNELIAPPTEAAGTPNEPIDPPVEAADIPGDDLGHAA